MYTEESSSTVAQHTDRLPPQHALPFLSFHQLKQADNPSPCSLSLAEGRFLFGPFCPLLMSQWTNFFTRNSSPRQQQKYRQSFTKKVCGAWSCVFFLFKIVRHFDFFSLFQSIETCSISHEGMEAKDGSSFLEPKGGRQAGGYKEMSSILADH